ncbi:MAG: hypothetical protein OHK0011_26370 [Turneriella sp.]
MKLLLIFSSLAIFAPALLAAESAEAGKKERMPHAKIIVRPGPPVKPTGPAKPVGNQKSDWGEASTKKTGATKVK